VIIVKVLYDKRELDTLAGRITLGMLVLQDLAVILFLAVQPSLNDLRVGIVLLSMVRVAILVASMLLVSRYVLPHVFRGVARVPELVLVGALAWCFLGGELAHHLQLSREMGALIAGVSLSTFPYALDVTAKVTSLRDFFVTLFFVGLGMTVPSRAWASSEPLSFWRSSPSPADSSPPCRRFTRWASGSGRASCRPSTSPRSASFRWSSCNGVCGGARDARDEERDLLRLRHPGRALHLRDDELEPDLAPDGPVPEADGDFATSMPRPRKPRRDRRASCCSGSFARRVR
jgi:hypothetical protein